MHIHYIRISYTINYNITYHTRHSELQSHIVHTEACLHHEHGTRTQFCIGIILCLFL